MNSRDTIVALVSLVAGISDPAPETPVLVISGLSQLRAPLATAP